MDKSYEQMSRQRRYTGGKKAYEKLLNILCHQGIAEGKTVLYDIAVEDTSHYHLQKNYRTVQQSEP